MIITIDGPAASGKGTLAHKLQAHYGFFYLDTGLLYRALAAYLMAHKVSPEPEILEKFNPESMPDETYLRTEAVSQHTSQIATDPHVRDRIRAMTRVFVHKYASTGIIVDGRDSGTVICPHADVKIFLLADPNKRAHRRVHQYGGTFDATLEAIQERDKRDKERIFAPMQPAADAHIIDTTHLSAEDVFLRVCAIIDRITA